MSVENNKTQQLKPLPRLEVVRDTYCSQEMTDKIISFLEQNHQKDLFELTKKDQGVEDSACLNVYRKLMELVIKDVSAHMSVPDSDLGYIDLSHELRRRYRKAYALPEPRVEGHPLAPTPHGPFPESLARKNITESSRKQGFSQAIVDRLVDQYFKDFPEWCYVQAEGFRRRQPYSFLTSGPFDRAKYFDNLIIKEFEPKHPSSARMQLQNEVADRIRLTCGIA